MSNEEIVEQLQQGIDTTANQERLWEQNCKYVRYAIWRMCGFCSEDLEQEGFLGLLNAAVNYRPDKETAFTTYAWYHIKAAILRYNANCCQSVRVPLYLKDRIRRYEMFRQQSVNDLHREPTEQEYIDELRISQKSLTELEKTIHNMNVVSLNADYSEEEKLPLIDQIRSDEDIESLITYSVYHVELKQALDSALAILDDTTANMIRSAFYQGNSWRQTAALFGCTVQAVSQRIHRGFWQILHSEHKAELEGFMWDGYRYSEDLNSEYAKLDENDFLV